MGLDQRLDGKAVTTIGIASLIAHLVPMLWHPRWLKDCIQWVGLPIGITAHEVLDFAFIIILSLYWWYISDPFHTRYHGHAFILGLVLMIEGHGVHLASNCMDKLLEGHNVPNSSELYKLNYFFDEYMGHHVWLLGESLIWYNWLAPPYSHPISQNSFSILVSLTITAIFQGFYWFLAAVEGQIVLLGFTFSLIVLSRCVFFPGSKENLSVMEYFLIWSCSLALLFLMAYGWYFEGSFPEFTSFELGPLKHWPRMALNGVNNRLFGY